MLRYIISILITAGIAFGARPFMTDDHGVVGNNTIEFEFGNDYTTQDKAMSSYLAIKHGFSPKSELDISLAYNYPGISDLNVFFKLNVANISYLHYTTSFSGDWGSKLFDINNIVSFEKGNLLLNMNISLLSSLQSVELGISPVYEIKHGFSLGADMRYNLSNKDISTLLGCTYGLSPFTLDFGAGYLTTNKSIYLTSGLVFDL